MRVNFPIPDTELSVATQPEEEESSTRSRNPSISTPPNGRRTLSRSITLHLLAQQANSSSTLGDHYHGFDHQSWWHSTKWMTRTNMFASLLAPLGVLAAWALLILVGATLLQGHEPGAIDPGGGTRGWFQLPPDVPVSLGGASSLLLAFRLNVCYSRFWEGRLLWGNVTGSARSLVTLLLSLEAESEPGSAAAQLAHSRAEGVAGWCIAFATALRLHLRSQPFDDHSSDLSTSLTRLLSQNGLAFGSNALYRLTHSGHPPLHALRSMRHAVVRVVSERRAAIRGGDVTALELELYRLTDEMHLALTGCERIVRTPCPPGYVGVLRSALIFFLALLPFVLLEVGYWMPLLVLMTGFVMLGAEGVAIQLEQPFGTELNDLPLGSFCLTLEADLLLLLDEQLHDSPASRRSPAVET